MSVIAGVDTGPLIYLAQLDRLYLLRDLYSPCVPQAVQLQAKQSGLLLALRSEINRLAKTNFYFSSVWIEAVLRAADEI
jgi:predicted nucleic acid-binding protein